jgi:hypothetical protein
MKISRASDGQSSLEPAPAVFAEADDAHATLILLTRRWRLFVAGNDERTVDRRFAVV